MSCIQQGVKQQARARLGRQQLRQIGSKPFQTRLTAARHHIDKNFAAVVTRLQFVLGSVRGQHNLVRFLECQDTDAVWIGERKVRVQLVEKLPRQPQTPAFGATKVYGTDLRPGIRSQRPFNVAVAVAEIDDLLCRVSEEQPELYWRGVHLGKACLAMMVRPKGATTWIGQSQRVVAECVAAQFLSALLRTW